MTHSDREVLDLAQSYPESFMFGIKMSREWMDDTSIPHENHELAVRFAVEFALDEKMDTELGAPSKEVIAIRLGAEIAAREMLKVQVGIGNE
jgi:hypothetical protein